MQKLYKYEPWETNEHIKENIQNSTMFFNIKRNFNDPFDMFPFYEPDEKSVRSLMEKMGRCIKPIDNNDEASLSKYLKTMLLARDRQTGDKYGVLCLSQCYNNILMWSHYSRNHTGVCLEYDVDETFIVDDKVRCSQPMLVEYTDKRIKNVPCANDGPEFEMNKIKRKYLLWSYEKEVRIIAESLNDELFPKVVKIRNGSLVGIVIGANMSLYQVALLLIFVHKNQLECNVSYMSLDDANYALKRNDLSKTHIINFLNNYIDLKNRVLRGEVPNVLRNLFNNLNNININEMMLFEHINMFDKDFCSKFSSDCDDIMLSLLKKHIEIYA